MRVGGNGLRILCLQLRASVNHHPITTLDPLLRPLAVVALQMHHAAIAPQAPRQDVPQGVGAYGADCAVGLPSGRQ